MAGVNKVILIGNLGRDPEVQNFENGLKKATFTLATTETYRNKEGSKEQHTEWHRIVLWRGLAEIAETYLKKGNQIFLEGRIKTRQWEDKEGKKQFTTEIEGTGMTMLGARREQTATSEQYVDEPQEAIVQEQPEDDLPF